MNRVLSAEIRGEAECIFMGSKRSLLPQLWKIALSLAIVAAAFLLRAFLAWQFGFHLSLYLTYLPPIIAIALLLGLKALHLSGKRRPGECVRVGENIA